MRIKAAWYTFRRFPIALLLTAKATGLGIWWTHLEENYAQSYIDLSLKGVPLYWHWNAIVSCYLGMLLSVAMTKWVEKRAAGVGTAGRGPEAAGSARGLMIGLQAGVIVLAAAYYWSLPLGFNSEMTIRTVVLAMGLHWLIAVVGFGRGEVNGFWVFNKRLFLRLLTTVLYSAVLYIGVVLALLAIDNLFHANIREEVYVDCLWVLGGLFSVWFFLAGFPKTYENPEVISDYPKGLKIFTQYVLLPLVTIYLLILYAYMFKIILTRNWPVGWVGWMIMAFAVAGILLLLLIYPLRNEKGSIWIRKYTRVFYLALLPLIILLYCAIYKRIEPYGITERRYFLLALACWLVFITVYFLVSRKKDIRMVPLSLCIPAFLSVWGPWGAAAVSLHSQRDRLKGLLEKNGLIVNGKIPGEGRGVKVPYENRKAISSVTDYLVEAHGYKALQPLFAQNIDSLVRPDAQAMVTLMHIGYATAWFDYADTSTVTPGVSPPDFSRAFRLYSDPVVVPTEGATMVAVLHLQISDADSCEALTFGKDRLRICVDTAGKVFRVNLNSTGGESVIDLAPLIQRILLIRDKGYYVPQIKVDLPLMGGPLGGKMMLTDVEGRRTDSSVTLENIEGVILFSRK